MEKRLDSRQYVADLEKHIDAMSDLSLIHI